MSSLVRTKTAPHKNPSVLPLTIPVKLGKVLQQSLHPSIIEKGYSWVFQNISDQRDPVSLIDLFQDHLEQKCLKATNGILADNLSIFRSALLSVCIIKLRPYRMRFADIGFNHIFIDTRLKKKLLAEIMGITLMDVERSIFLSDKRTRDFIEEKLQTLIPLTFLRNIYKP